MTFSTTDADPGVALPDASRFTAGVSGDNGLRTFPGAVTLITVGNQPEWRW